VGAEVRFIEYMDVGGATHWSLDRVVSRDEILDLVKAHYGAVEPEGEQGTAPAERFCLPGGTRFGIIASVTEPFCGACDRSRLTADGVWYLCLYAREGTDLRPLLRNGADSLELLGRLRQVWQGRADRGAEERLQDPDRGVFYQIEELRADPHREMHTRGG
jgi:cyclic pyranopterin phosphate synthase